MDVTPRGLPRSNQGQVLLGSPPAIAQQPAHTAWVSTTITSSKATDEIEPPSANP